MSEMARQLEIAERRLSDARADARQLAAQNERLNQTLRDARDKLVQASEQLAALAQPPLSVARLISVQPDDGVAQVSLSGRMLQVALDVESPQTLQPGDEILLNDTNVLVGRLDATTTGDLATVVETDDDTRTVIVSSGGGEQTRLTLCPAIDELPAAGDTLLVDQRAGLALRTVHRARVAELVLEEVPDVTYDDIGGMAVQITQIRDAVELPCRHRDLYRRYGLEPPKGVLLYGPPGCGKTMIAKAVANSLGVDGSHFLNVKGPELLNKYVGESERQIWEIFSRAREHAEDGKPVIVFFDEMDSLFRTRGSGVSSDVESTIVPQLLSEIDGVEGLENVIVIGASNREDLIDPAILRPGRLDVKIRLDRPDADGARQIFEKYITENTPLSEKTSIGAVIDVAVQVLYSPVPENRFVEVTYASGDREVLYQGDFVSGAMVHNIVDRAKTTAIKAEIDGAPGGVSTEGIREACLVEFSQNEDLVNTTNPDDWAKISGRKGERIVFIRTLVSGSPASVPLPHHHED